MFSAWEFPEGLGLPWLITHRDIRVFQEIEFLFTKTQNMLNLKLYMVVTDTLSIQFL